MESAGGLNPAQQKAAAHRNGPLLVVAGAGAGKTRTIAYRIMNLIESGVDPQNILAVTFTNKAAKEMRDRITLSENRYPTVSTFHSLCVKILRESGETIGVSRYFTILDKGDQISLIRKCVKEAGFDPKQFAPDKIASVISKQKGNLVGVHGFEKDGVASFFGDIVAQVWRKYEQKLALQKSLDFDDLILKTVTLFRDHPQTLAYYQDRWHYIHIDEYQDTNAAQYELARLLADKRKNICVVGDVDQSIYSWRGANFENVLNFEKDYPDTTVILLEENYRSTKTILAAAENIISKNVMRKEKRLFTNRTDGEKISLFEAIDESHEARRVVVTARELAQNGTPLSEIAVLYRANFQSRVLEEALLRAGVPYQLVGTRFFERKEVKDVLAYLRAAINPDDLEAFSRALNTPARGIGEVTFDKIAAGRTNELSPSMKEKLASFAAILDDIRKMASETKSSDLVKFIMKRSGLEKSALDHGEEERVENMQELVTLAAKYDSLESREAAQKLVEDAALAADQDDLIKESDAVRLMTIHAAKGLEFDHVFIVGLEQNLFPHRRLDDSSDPEEERRLCYVALTRAREQLHLSYAASRTIFGSRQFNLPSEFLSDIDPHLLENESGIMHHESEENGEDIIQWDSLLRPH